MVVFHSYVSLPEGRCGFNRFNPPLVDHVPKHKHMAFPHLRIHVYPRPQTASCFFVKASPRKMQKKRPSVGSRTTQLPWFASGIVLFFPWEIHYLGNICTHSSVRDRWPKYVKTRLSSNKQNLLLESACQP